MGGDDAARDGRSRLCAAVDVPSAAEAGRLARALAGRVGVLKVGLELFVAEGQAAIDAVRGAAPGARLFLDLKLCDIPETVARAVRATRRAAPSFLTVHASGGREMLRRAVAAAAEAEGGPSILAVTVLTSLDADDLAAQGVAAPSPSDHAVRLAHLAWEAGVRGFVCSAREAGRFRAELPDALLVTPGIRPGGAAGAGDDQKRVETPRAAILAGADLLVVGRPLRDAPDPGAAADGLAREIGEAVAERGASAPAAP